MKLAVGREPGRILVVTQGCTEYERLASLFSQSSWSAECVRKASDARQRLAQPNPPGVVLCEARLPDGGWRDVLAAAGVGPGAPRVIVMARPANDDLWQEVLEGGAFDLVSLPVDSRELFRVVSLAWNHWAAHRGELRNKAAVA
ncbi:MAG: hypothetical protein R2729_15075 [Bryobacteraceae bacterium]